MKPTLNITFDWNSHKVPYRLYYNNRLVGAYYYFSSVIEAIQLLVTDGSCELFVDGVPARQWIDQQYDDIGESPVRHEFWS